MAYIAGIPIRDSIHTDFSTGFSVWAAYRSVLTGEFVSGGGVISGRYGEFTKDIQEYNRKADTLTGAWGDRNDTGMFLGPFNAGFRYTGTGDFVTYSREVDPLDLNPYLYFLGSEGVTTAGGAVSAWSQVSAGSNQLGSTLAQGTADYQPDNATEESIDFDGSDDRLAFDVAVAQAGILITATSNGIFAFEVNSDSVDEITALGFETGYFRDLDLFGYALLPTTATDSQIASVIKYFSENTSATKNPTGALDYYWWYRTDILTPKFDALDFSGVTVISGFRFSGLTSFPSVSWDGLGEWGIGYAFWGCSDLVSIGTPTGDTSGPLYYMSAFRGCSSLTSMPLIDTSNALEFNSTWHDCSSLTEFPVLDLSSGTSFTYAWYSCTSLAEFPALDLSSGTDFSYAWRSCTALTSFSEVDTSSGTNFAHCWELCSSLTSFPLLDVSSGTSFNWCWALMSSLASFPLLDLSSATDLSACWWGCSSLTEFPELDVSSGTSFFGCWNSCSGLTSFPSLDVSSGTSFGYAWNSCSGLTSFPSDIDVSSGTDFSYSWRYCNSLVSFPLLDVSSGTNFTWTWSNCTALTSFPLLDVSSGTNFSTSWYHCENLTSFPELDVSNGTTFQHCWNSCRDLTSFPELDVSSGTDFSYCWTGCSGLTSFPLLDVSSGTNFAQCWYACTGLISFPSLDVSSGTSFATCWYTCWDMTTFPAGFFDNWSPASVNDNCFKNAWGGCTSLTATSVENILNSLATAGVAAPSSGVDITIDFDDTSGTPDISSAVTTLKGLSPAWTITLNGVAQ